MNALLPVTIPRGDASTWEGQFDVGELVERVKLCRKPAPTSREKGQRLEDLTAWLFPHIPGFQVRNKDVFDSAHSQEIDILIWNYRLGNGFPVFGEIILAECKNWERPVDSSDIAWFYWKMRLAGVRQGFLIAANGITTKQKRRQHAQNLLTEANSGDGRQIFVLALDEIEGLTSREGLRELIIDKSLALAAQAVFS